MHLLSIVCLLIGFSWTHGECPDKFNAVGGSCYHFGNDQALNWENSRIHCTDLDPDADLATFASCDQFTEVVNYIMYEGYDIDDTWSYWIGATDHGEEGVWKWVDINLGDVPSGVPFWGVMDGVKEPNGGDDQNCAMLNKDDRYYIHDGECDLLGLPMCQTEPF